jgi:hypothetical protein
MNSGRTGRFKSSCSLGGSMICGNTFFEDCFFSSLAAFFVEDTDVKSDPLVLLGSYS